MKTVLLFTDTGMFVTEVELPTDFFKPRTIIMWSNRYFIQAGAGYHNQWHEVFAYVAPLKVDPGPGV